MEKQEVLGLLRINVRRGYNLAIRDVRSSDPYVIVRMGKQKLKTRVIKKNLNPEWNENLTLCITDPTLPVKIMVYDRDTFSLDDKMGDAEFDIRPFLEAVMWMKAEAGGPPCANANSNGNNGNGTTTNNNTTIIRKLIPNRQNCLAEESCIAWKNGKLVQDIILRLRNVECGEIDLQLQWIDPPTLTRLIN